MGDLFKMILILHIIGGGTGLIAGTINTIRKKGDRIHRLIGKCFLYGMLTSATCALILSVLHPNYFLFIVGIFTIYMTGTGVRYLSLKQLGDGQKPALVDWALTGSMLLFSAAFIGFGIYNLVQGKTFGLVFVAFGYISSRMVRSDIKNYMGASEIKNIWFVTHLQRMIGAYIAAITAFLVVNFPQDILPGRWSFAIWLFPSVVLVLLILVWTKKYEVKRKEA
ncbi:MAG: hypothetical protein JWO03_2493 [Bacteroidetes bacterium]|nr:hypothetical protein [Bacteroidota bacterium]